MRERVVCKIEKWDNDSSVVVVGNKIDMIRLSFLSDRLY